jgi:hypothetical protein
VPPQSILRLSDVLKKLGRSVQVIYRENGGHQTDYADTTTALEYVIGSVLDNSPPAEREKR